MDFRNIQMSYPGCCDASVGKAKARPKLNKHQNGCWYFMVASGFHMVLHRLQSLTVYDPLRGLEVTEVLFASWREAFHPSKRTVIQLESESEKKRQIYLGIKSPPFFGEKCK